MPQLDIYSYFPIFSLSFTFVILFFILFSVFSKSSLILTFKFNSGKKNFNILNVNKIIKKIIYKC